MSSGWFYSTEPSLSTSLQGQQSMQGVAYLFGVVQAHRTSSNLLEPHHYRDSKVYRVHLHEFEVVRLDRTFSIYIITEIARCAGCLCACSGWFKRIKPRRTFSNHIITEIARYIEFIYTSSRWFDWTELSLTTSLQEIGVQGAICTCLGWFKHIEPPRTFLNHIITKIKRCVEFCYKSSGWFDCTEPSLSTSLQEKEGMQGVVHLFGVVQTHRTSSNLLELHHYKDSKVCRVLSQEFWVVRLYRTFSIYIVTGATRYAGCCALVRCGSSTSNLLEPS